MARIRAEWQNVTSAESLKRSSQVLSVIGDTAYIFGGELVPRQPRDNDVHVIQLSSEGISSNFLILRE
jgi:Galactose oxidase, central domain